MTESGLVIVDKSAGLTSHDVVARIRRIAGTRRVGHAGTLDPMATGVLVVGIEKATRLLGHLMLTEKEYSATIRLGQSTTTDDADGEILSSPDGLGSSSGTSGLDVPGRSPLPPTTGVIAAEVSGLALQSALAAFTGTIQQVPPGISAIKVNGKRAYHLTRSGAAPELAARPVTVRRLELLAVRTAGDLLDIDVEVTCSSGTYIRAIARDLGAVLGTGGHLTALRRTRVGPYLIGTARTLHELATSFEFIPLADAAAGAFARRDLTADEARLVSHGARLPAVGLHAAESARLEPDVLATDDLATDDLATDDMETVAHCAAVLDDPVHPVQAAVLGPVVAAGPVAPGAVAAADSAVPGPAAVPGPVAAFGPDGTLIALLVEKDGEMRSLAVFVP